MVKLDESYKKVLYNNRYYAICDMIYNNVHVPVILDWSDYKILVKLNKNWYINSKGYVMTQHNNKEIILHDIIMYIRNNNSNKPIIHINKLGIDNRYENLIRDNENNNIIKKNIRKKSRTINLSKYNIDTNELPSYVWYMKSNDSHGDRFFVKIGSGDNVIEWKSTSSKNLSLRYKLEETKKYLRHLRKIRNDLFNIYSMNGDLNQHGKLLMKSFLDISNKAGYNLSNHKLTSNNTDKFLKEDLDGLSSDEIALLKSIKF